MAVLLGAFQIHGLVPGPAMLSTHTALVMSFAWTIAIGNIITVAFCFLFLNHIAAVTFIRGSLLIPPIILLIYVGSFAEKNALMDLSTVFIFGMLGIAMHYLDWPRPPLVLGLVLGSLGEGYLFLSVQRYGWEMFARPMVVAIVVLMLAAICFPLFQARLQRKLGPTGVGEIRVTADDV
jgi:TctA family transporter